MDGRGALEATLALAKFCRFRAGAAPSLAGMAMAMDKTEAILARYRRARSKPRRVVSVEEFHRACAALGWPQDTIRGLLARAKPGVWCEVGDELLRVKITQS